VGSFLGNRLPVLEYKFHFGGPPVLRVTKTYVLLKHPSFGFSQYGDAVAFVEETAFYRSIISLEDDLWVPVGK
jgi:hypothetical protein